MMGTQHSTLTAQEGGNALAWSAEVTWSDDDNGSGHGAPSSAGRPTNAGDEEWCTGSLDSASDTGTGGGDVVLSWSWTSSWR